MSSSSAYSLQLPYLGSIPLGKSPPNLTSFQKPLRELYIPYYRQRRERYHDERRIIISDRDILIFEPDAASKGKRSLIYSTLEAIVDIQALELYVMFNHIENHQHKRIRAAFLPIGCEHQERFRSLYSTIDKSQYHLLSTPSSSCHPPLVLFVMRKTGAGGTCSLLDCHVFAVRRESVAFELCDMIRKLIIKRTVSPALPTSSATLLRVHENDKDTTIERRTKYLDRDRPISAMEHQQADIQTGADRKQYRLTSNGLTNPLSSSSYQLTNNQDISQVLHIDKDPHPPSDILVSVRDVCSRLNAITNIYPRFQTLTSLDLQCSNLTHDAAQRLSNALKSNQTLTTLNLRFCSIDALKSEYLGNSLKSNQTLTTLDFLSNDIDDEGACCLADALKINQAITRLDLTRNNIGSQGAQYLADALRINQTLKILSLSDNTISEDGACYLSDALKINKTLVTLHLHGNGINDKGAQHFADMIMVNQELITLDLSSNVIGDEGAYYLSDSLKINQALITLQCNSSSISDAGVRYLADGLRINQTLTKLNLRSACIGVEGAQFLGDALPSNRTLTELDISFNRISDDGAQYLSNGLKNNQSLRILMIQMNNIGDKGAQYLGNAVKINQTLTTLNLRNNGIGDEGAGHFADGIKINTTNVITTKVSHSHQKLERINIILSQYGRSHQVNKSPMKMESMPL
ncbi:unnamed protein product [Adineta steineri]|uniref:Uncharacterized protein n=1 Tax=Adineta steineri TaxID=433720 RepID=A0A815AB56_9BILA|nr:unnamed protein product [Adineta steineri]